MYEIPIVTSGNRSARWVFWYNVAMKIFFAGSIRGGRKDSKIYARAIDLLSNYGQVLNKHVGDMGLSALGEKGSTLQIHKREMMRIQKADILIADITIPSLGVGYEIAKAEEMGKKILCIYRKIEGKSISAMISGSKNLTLKKYKNVGDIQKIFERFCRESGIIYRKK